MTKKHERHLEATKKQVAKLLELDEEEKEILEAGINMAAAIGASEQGDKMNRQLRKFNKELVEEDKK